MEDDLSQLNCRKFWQAEQFAKAARISVKQEVICMNVVKHPMTSDN